MRLVLVPLAMLSTPQQLAVLVNCWSLMSTSSGSSPAATVITSPLREASGSGGAITFARTHPELTATVFDLPGPIEIARANIAKNGLEARLNTLTGNFLQDDIGSGYDYMGEFDKAIPTNVKEIQLGFLFPKLAQQADKYSLIRSMTHGNNGHETATYLMQTGHLPGGRLAYPSVGAIFAFFKKDEYKGLIPPYVVMLEAAGRFSEEGFLGPAYKPFATGGDPNAPRFEVQGIVNREIDDGRQKARRELADKVNLFGYGLADAPEMAALWVAHVNAVLLGERAANDTSHVDAAAEDEPGASHASIATLEAGAAPGPDLPPADSAPEGQTESR
jgi:hypothetical protein